MRLDGRFFILAGAFCALLLTELTGGPDDQSRYLGRITDRITCASDVTQSYALYLPSYYTGERAWPVILCFDASARGRTPVELFQAAAEHYGYIIAGSLNSRNGPWAANATASQALLKDVISRFSIDPRRVYTAGVSGGARVATAIALSGTAHAVIACAAGFPLLPGGVPQKIPFGFFGTTGTEDFNFAEMMRLDAALDQREAAHRIVVFTGGHSWAPAAVLQEAVEWLEIYAMRTGARARDDALIQTLLRARVAAVPDRPALEKWRSLKAIVADFEGLAEVETFRQSAQKLASSRELKGQLRIEQSLLVQEEDLLTELGGAAIEEDNRKQALARELRRTADKAEDTPQRRMVRRVIAGYTSISRETVRELFENREYERAVALLKLADVLRPSTPQTLYDLARGQAHLGQRKTARQYLERAAALGFKDIHRIESDTAFTKLRTDPDFQKTLERIRVAASDPPVELPAMRISAAMESVELRPFYLRNPLTELPILSFLRVETVRTNSTAEEAGLKEGMDITALQGRRIRGMMESDLAALMNSSIHHEIILSVRESDNDADHEIRIPLRKVTAK